MDIKISFYSIALFAGVLASVFLLSKIKLMYKDPSIITTTPQSWWPYSDKAWRKYARVIHLSPVFFPFVLIGGLIAEYGDVSNQVVRIFLLLSGFIVFFGFLLGIFVAFTGRPKWLIPPHLR